jgi:hypothetical protein
MSYCVDLIVELSCVRDVAVGCGAFCSHLIAFPGQLAVTQVVMKVSALIDSNHIHMK